jgi:hypothetical protein
VQAYVLELRAQGPPGDAQQKGGALLIPAGVLQDVGEHEPIQLPVDLPVHVAGIGAKPLADERLRIEVTPGAGAGAAGSAGASGSSGRKSGSRTGPWARRIACFSTLCSSRTFPGQK